MFDILLTALHSVWYHLAPQAFRLQLCWLSGRFRDEHSYGGMTEIPSSDFTKHTTALCWLPGPHSAEHWLITKQQMLLKKFNRNKSKSLTRFSYLTPGTREPLDAVLTGTIIADPRVCRTLAATPLQRQTANVVCEAEDPASFYTHPTFSRALGGKMVKNGECGILV